MADSATEENQEHIIMNVTNYQIKIPNSIVSKVFRIALEQRGNFFHNIRLAFKRELETIFENHGLHVNSNTELSSANLLRNNNFIEDRIVTKYTGYNKDVLVKIDAKFCAQYGHDDYSIEAINYIDREFRNFPSLLPFKEITNYFLGNILVLVDNKNYGISISAEEGLNITGYTFDISSKKKKSYICLLGVHFSYELLLPIFKDFFTDCTHPKDSLDEIRVDNTFFPVTFICRRCGKILTCSCFEEYLCIKNGLTVQHIDIGVKSGICHLCTGNVPNQTYLSSPMPSAFLLRYMPYHYLFSLRKHGKFIFSQNFSQDKEYREIENEVREQFGYPKIGEKWISETILYKIVRILFPSLEVIHHYRGKELEGLEIDVWMPELKVGIEYQGVQHFEVIEHWGGIDGLRKRSANDKKKKILCKSLGYNLIEFRYDENLTEDKLRKKLEPYLR